MFIRLNICRKANANATSLANGHDSSTVEPNCFAKDTHQHECIFDRRTKTLVYNVHQPWPQECCLRNRATIVSAGTLIGSRFRFTRLPLKPTNSSGIHATALHSIVNTITSCKPLCFVRRAKSPNYC